MPLSQLHYTVSEKAFVTANIIINVDHVIVLVMTEIVPDTTQHDAIMMTACLTEMYL
jgi:hypothetical protein